MKKYLFTLLINLFTFSLIPAAYAQDSEVDKKEMRLNLLSKVHDSDKIIFKATNEKHKITVFTDITCPFCAKFHSQINSLNDAGITVEYLAFPRDGLGSESLQVMQNIWCSENKQQVFTLAELNHQFPSNYCKSNQVANQYLLGMTIGVYGTPSFILPNGELLAGYLPLSMLESLLNGE